MSKSLTNDQKFEIDRYFRDLVENNGDLALGRVEMTTRFGRMGQCYFNLLIMTTVDDNEDWSRRK